jgi:hypothetical protein
MFKQTRVCGWPNSSQQDEIKIIVINGNLEVISGLDLAACPYSFG